MAIDLRTELARCEALRAKLSDHPASNAKKLQRIDRRIVAIKIDIQRARSDDDATVQN